MILELLNWDLSAITPYCILDQLLKRLIQPLSNLQSSLNVSEVRSHAEAFVAVASTEADFMTTPPCLIAVASLISALTSLKSTLPKEPLTHFVQTLLSLTGVSLENVSQIILRFENLAHPNNTSMQISPSYCNNKNSISRTPTEMVEISCAFWRIFSLPQNQLYLWHIKLN